jgi:hypothetical protein
MRPIETGRRAPIKGDRSIMLANWARGLAPGMRRVKCEIGYAALSSGLGVANVGAFAGDKKIPSDKDISIIVATRVPATAPAEAAVVRFVLFSVLIESKRPVSAAEFPASLCPVAWTNIATRGRPPGLWFRALGGCDDAHDICPIARQLTLAAPCRCSQALP